jgi:hypothetical protein
MKNSESEEYRVFMQEFAQALFRECVDSLAMVNMDDPDFDHRFYDDLFHFPAALHLREQVARAKEKENVELELADWIVVYTALSVYCLVFSEKAIAKMKIEVLVHPEITNEYEIGQIIERGPKVRLLIHNLEKRFGHKPLFQHRIEVMKKRGWFNLMDPVPKFNVLK